MKFVLKIWNMQCRSKKSERYLLWNVITWDRAVICSWCCFTAVDHMMWYQTGGGGHFGRRVVMRSRDFRQVLPVTESGSGTQIVYAWDKSFCFRESGGLCHFPKNATENAAKAPKYRLGCPLISLLSFSSWWRLPLKWRRRRRLISSFNLT